MKLIHLGDLHLGRSLLDFDLIPDQSYILDRIIQLALEHQADAVIIAGDVYDRPVPSEAAVNLFDSFLCRLAEQGTHTFIISGNHDSDDRLNFGSSLFRSSRIYIASKYRGELFHHVLQDGYGDIHVYLLPFVKASQVRHYLPDEDIVSCDGAVRALIRHAGIDPGERNIIAAHQFVTGVSGSHPETGGSEGMAVLQVGLKPPKMKKRTLCLSNLKPKPDRMQMQSQPAVHRRGTKRLRLRKNPYRKQQRRGRLDCRRTASLFWRSLQIFCPLWSPSTFHTFLI